MYLSILDNSLSASVSICFISVVQVVSSNRSITLSYVADFFRGPVVEKIRLIGLEQALTFTLSEGKIYVRNYRYVQYVLPTETCLTIRTGT